MTLCQSNFTFGTSIIFPERQGLVFVFYFTLIIGKSNLRIFIENQDAYYPTYLLLTYLTPRSNPLLASFLSIFKRYRNTETVWTRSFNDNCTRRNKKTVLSRRQTYPGTSIDCNNGDVYCRVRLVYNPQMYIIIYYVSGLGASRHVTTFRSLYLRGI